MKVNTTRPFYKWEVVILLWIAFFLNQADRQAFNIVLPNIQEHLGASDSTMGLIAMLFNLFYAVTVPFAGYFADRMSRSRQIWVSTLIFSTATLFTGLSGGIFSFILFRCFGMGLGQGMFGPTYTGLIAEYHDSLTRARAMSLHQTSYYIGVITCGFLAGWVAEKLGWQYAFFIFGGIGIAFTAILALRLKDKAPEEILSTGEADKGRDDVPSLPTAIGAIFKVPTAVCMLVAYCGLIFGLNGYLTWMPKYLKETFNLSLSSAGFHSMFWTYVAAFVGVLVAGTLSDKLAVKNNKYRMYLQALGLACGAIFLFFMGGKSSLVLVYICFAGWGFFRAFFDANTYSVLYDVTPERLHASCGSVMGMTGFAIGALAPVILGAIKQRVGSLESVFPILAAIWIVCSIMMLIVAKLCYQRDHDKIYAHKTDNE